MLAMAATFMFTARAVRVTINPAPDTFRFTSGFSYQLGERYLMLPGNYELTTGKSGYHMLSTSIEVNGDPDQNFNLELQKLPGKNLQIYGQYLRRLNETENLAQVIATEAGDVPKLLDRFLTSEGKAILQEQPVFQCACSVDSFRSGIKSLDNDSLTELFVLAKPVETVCQYCLKKYVFLPEEISRILKEKSK